MKQLIFGCALFILWSLFLVFQFDNNQYLRYLNDLKYQADECASTGSVFYDEIVFSEGRKVFSRNDSNDAIKTILKANLLLDNSFVPIAGSYWKDQISYYVYYFDDSGFIYTYKNNVLQSQTDFSFNYLFTEPLTGFQKLISEPSVIVTIDAGQPKFRLSFLEPKNTIRTSAYEYMQRN